MCQDIYNVFEGTMLMGCSEQELRQKMYKTKKLIFIDLL